MDRVEFDGVELTWEITGSGEPVVLVHAGAFVPWYAPLVERMPGFAVLRYTRRFIPDRGATGPFTIADDAALCACLLDHAGWPAAHVAGHSYGALVAVQLALDAPERVRSLVLLEPAIRDIPSSEQAVAALRPAIAAYRDGDREAAMDLFLGAVCGGGYREILEQVVPGALRHAVEQADLFFGAEMPAVAGWSFGLDEARRVTQPVLNVAGTRSASRFVEGAEVVQGWFPHAERFSLEGAGHLLMVENPEPVVRALSDFFSRHATGDQNPPASPGSTKV